MKLRTHYLLLAFFIIVPLVAGSSLALKMLLDAHREAAVGRIEDSSRAIAMMVDAELARALAVTRTLAASRALADDDLEAFYREAAAANAGPGAWIILYDATGQQLVNTRLPSDTALPARRDTATLKRMISAGGSDVTGLKWGSVINENFVTAEQGIVAGSGRRYLIAQAFSPAYFAGAFRSQILPAGWMIDLVDRNGKVIAGSAGAGNEAVPAQVPPAPGLRKISLRGAPVYAYVSRSDLSGWSALVGAPAAEIDAVVWRGMAAALGGMLLAALVAGTLAVRTGRRLLRFMRRAGDAAAALGQGRDIGALQGSRIVEMEALNQALRDASVKLAGEMASRASAETERNALLVLERSARAVAEEQNAAKDEFLAMLGHELRNPLSAIAAAVALLDDGRAPDAFDRARKVLQRQTAHLRALVDDLLDVNRALMGKLTLQRQRLDLAAVARECVDLRRAGGRLGRCTIRVDTQAALVDADPTRLMQIIDNILDNAVKYSPDGGTIAVAVASEGTMATLTISDAGIGIPAELLPRVFQVFVQGEQTLQRALGGLGIGLTLVRRLADMHEGSVDIDSPGAGLGTRVVLRLPLLHQPLPPPAGDAAGALAGDGAARQPGALRILLVEDNADAREMLAMMLELFGHEVVQAADGPAALLAAAARPDLAIVDIGLPGMDGHAIARALRADPATAAMRLVALTGYGNEDSRQTALAAGFDLYVTKPISPENLRRICRL